MRLWPMQLDLSLREARGMACEALALGALSPLALSTLTVATLTARMGDCAAPSTRSYNSAPPEA